MGTLADLLRDSRFWKDTGQGLTDSVNRGAVAGLLGGPVDAVSGVVNAGLMGLGYAGNKLGLLGADRMPQPIQKPVGGSEWIGDLLQRGKMVSENRNAPAEMLAGLLAPSAVKGASKAAFAAENNAMASTPYNTAMRNQLGATVWHGSPHKFDKFDSSKIGTGEGAQAYGHGLYLAESPGVAKSYRDKLSTPTYNPEWMALYGEDVKLLSEKSKINSLINKESINSGAKGTSKEWGNIDAELPEIRNKYLPELERIESELLKIRSKRNQLPKIVEPEGQLYKVDLPDEHIAKMLDWDRPIPESQRAPISAAAMKQFGSGSTGTSGEHLYREVVKEFERSGSKNPKEAATEWLRQQGVPGIKYLDAGSRGPGTGTSNYVVFPGNEGLLKILERNGQPIK